MSVNTDYMSEAAQRLTECKRLVPLCEAGGVYVTLPGGTEIFLEFDAADVTAMKQVFAAARATGIAAWNSVTA